MGAEMVVFYTGILAPALWLVVFTCSCILCVIPIEWDLSDMIVRPWVSCVILAILVTVIHIMAYSTVKATRTTHTHAGYRGHNNTQLSVGGIGYVGAVAHGRCSGEVRFAHARTRLGHAQL